MKWNAYRSLVVLGSVLGFASAGSALEEGQSTDASANVARAQVTSAIENREPVDELSVVPATRRTVFFFTELRNLAGAEVTHRWSHAGEVVAEVPFQVGGNRWRVWSSKELDPVWAGEWQLTVIDTDGTLLDTQTFVLQDTAADTAAKAAMPEAPATPDASQVEAAATGVTTPPAKPEAATP